MSDLFISIARAAQKAQAQYDALFGDVSEETIRTMDAHFSGNVEPEAEGASV